MTIAIIDRDTLTDDDLVRMCAWMYEWVVCFCVCIHTHKHTHTHTYIYIYRDVCKYLPHDNSVMIDRDTLTVDDLVCMHARMCDLVYMVVGCYCAYYIYIYIYIYI
jgi:hypothetical protein